MPQCAHWGGGVKAYHFTVENPTVHPSVACGDSSPPRGALGTINPNLKKGVFCNTPFYNYNNIGCNCFPSEAAAKASGIRVKSATMDVGFF